MSRTRRPCCILIFAALCLGHVQGISVGSKNEAANAAPLKDASLMLPEISHYKNPGGDYKKESPLFSRQEAWKHIGLVEHPPTPKKAYSVPVSNTMRCVVIMSSLFFFLFSALFVVQTLYRLGFRSLKNQEAALAAAAQSLFFTPMLAVLFLATRMRAVQLARGQEPALFNLPQKWVRQAESASTAASVVISVTTLVAAGLSGTDWENTAKRARSDSGKDMMLSILLTVRRAVTLFLYVAFTVVSYGAMTMEPPEEIWTPEENGPEVSPALQCTIFLSAVYFVVYLGLAVAKMFNESGILGPPLRFSVGQTIFKHAATTVALVPMLSVLFIAVRMRSLQFDPLSGNPPAWIQMCFYACSASVFALVLLAVFGGVQEKDQTLTPNITLGGTSCWQTFTEVIRLMLMSGLYTWTLAILYGMVHMEAPHEDAMFQIKEPLPASVTCVSILCMLYFSVYMMLWVNITFYGESAASKNSDKASEIQPAERMGGLGVQAAREAVGFCPMLCVIFLGVMLRAMQVSHGYGAPPDICQKAMYLGTASAVVLTFSRLFMSCDYAPQAICVVLQYLSLVAMYSSISLVILCLVNLTPKTAHGTGSIVPRTRQGADLRDQIGDGVAISDMMSAFF
eukprot:TRINITY_DN94126_c0_g1_i1.p1 TRINITY_DN94126_c0_g1~~TRINITY_DN94126_c0_g1_i1.p1  ORF type:complete len:624 (+),score=114.80 TRINITY_DN94126_c0_g1_i1:61-1932(+)